MLNPEIQGGNSDFINELLDMGIIVEDAVDENACLELDRKIALYSFSEEVGFVIAPTMDCNARCFYCYENETSKVCYMDYQTEKAVISYIKKWQKVKKFIYFMVRRGTTFMCRLD